jgi:large subunit ribosomal protein L13
MNRQTTLAKASDVKPRWWVVDATDLVLGRLSSRVAVVLMGKHKPTYTPHTDTGDVVVVVNAGKLRVTGSKAETKFFQAYTGYPGGQKNYSYKWMLAHKPELLLERSVRRMLPKNKLAAHMLKKLKIYAGPTHPHQAQKLEPMKIGA